MRGKADHVADNGIGLRLRTADPYAPPTALHASRGGVAVQFERTVVLALISAHVHDGLIPIGGPETRDREDGVRTVGISTTYDPRNPSSPACVSPGDQAELTASRGIDRRNGATWNGIAPHATGHARIDLNDD